MSSIATAPGSLDQLPRSTRRQPTNQVAVIGFLFGSMVFSLFIVLIGLAVGVRDGDIACLIWAALTVSVAAIPIALDYGRPAERRHIFLSMLSIGYMVNIVVPVLALYIPAEGPMDPAAMAGSNLLPRDIATGQWIALVGLISLLAGYSLPVGGLARAMLPTTGYQWAQLPALGGTLVLTSIAWMVYSAGATGLLPASLGTGWISGVASGAVSGAAVLTATYLHYRSRAAWTLLVILVPLTTLINFMSGSKTAILLPGAMVVMTWVIVNRKIRPSWIIAGILAVSMLYPVAQFWREDILQRNTLTTADVIVNPGPALQRTAAFLGSNRIGDYFGAGLQATGRRLDAIGVASVIIRDTPSISPFQNGRTLALIPIAFIPRILWPGKPVIPIGRWISDTYTQYGYMSETNLAASWIGEFYLNFGVLGVMGGMLTLGLILRFLQETLIRNNATIPMTVIAAILITTLMVGVQEAVIRSMTTPVTIILPILLMHGAIRMSGGVRRVALDERQPR